jgi:hypothetical protein
MNMKRLFLVGVSAGLVLSLAAAAQQATPQGPQLTNEWPSVGNDPGGMKFSPLTQITPAECDATHKGLDLRPGCAGERIHRHTHRREQRDVPAGAGAIITALSADSGKELWKQDLRKFEASGGNPSAGGRGISYWPGTPQTGPRIVIATTNGFLVQLNARNRCAGAGPGRHRQPEHRHHGEIRRQLLHRICRPRSTRTWRSLPRAPVNRAATACLAIHARSIC